jgi:biotin carboxyl carrier protein
MKKYEYLINGKPFVVEVLSFDGRRGDVRVNNVAYSVEVPQGPAAGAPVYATPSLAVPPPVQAAAPASAPTPPPAAPVPAAAPASAPTPPPVTPVPAAAPSAAASSDSMVVAPMPGIILSILVQEGDEVAAGDAMLVLEAMKMENEIHASRAGKIKKIHVSEGAEVQSGSRLIELE